MPLYLFSDVYYCNYIVLKIILCLYRRFESVLLGVFWLMIPLNSVNMAQLQNKTKDNPKLEQRPLKDGRISLYLEYYLGRTETLVVDEDGDPVLYTSEAMAGKPKVKITHNRKKESLPYYLIASPKTLAERQQNKEILELAKRVRYEREEELKENKHGYRLKKEKVEINYLDWMAEYHANYTKSDGNQICRARPHREIHPCRRFPQTSRH